MIISKITIDDCQNSVEKWYFHPYKKYYRFYLLLNSILEFAVERNYIHRMLALNPQNNLFVEAHFQVVMQLGWLLFLV